MLQRIKKIVIVAGCQRSGTTLVGQILGAHPNALLIDEPDNLYDWFRAYTTKDPRASDLLRHTIDLARSKYRSEKIRVKRKPDGNLSISPSITHIILKAPNLSYCFKEAAQLDIPVSIVYPVRDPRAVVASMTALKHISIVENQLELIKCYSYLVTEYADEISMLEDDTLSPHIKYTLIWRIKSFLYKKFIEHGLATFMFRYEDLVADLDKTCAGMADHVDLTFDDRMLAHEDIFRSFGPGFTERTRPVDALSMNRWLGRLTCAQEEDVLNLAADEMKKLGYKQIPQKGISHIPRKVEQAVLHSPIIITGRGGSGTRIISELAERSEVFLGNRLNASRDSIEWVSLLYEMVINKQFPANGGSFLPDDEWNDLLLHRANEILDQGNWKAGQLWGWKLPESMLIIPELFAAFPDAKLIHLTRHPVDCSLRRTHMTSRFGNPIGVKVLRDAYSSAGLRQSLVRNHGEYMNNAVSWLYQVESVMSFARANISAKQYLEIRFEDFCANPVAAQHKLLQFIGNNQELPALTKINSGRVQNYDPADPRVKEIWELCKDTALKLGYEASR